MNRYNVSLPGGATVAYDGVDFKNDFKLGGFFPLPGGAQFSLVLNSVTGRLTGDIQRVDELLPVNWVITRNTVYTADGGSHGRSPTCQGATINGAPCMPGMPVVPDMVQSSITVPVAPAGTIHQLPRTNMLNFSFQRIFNAGGVEFRPAARDLQRDQHRRLVRGGVDQLHLRRLGAAEPLRARPDAAAVDAVELVASRGRGFRPRVESRPCFHDRGSPPVRRGPRPSRWTLRAPLSGAA